MALVARTQVSLWPDIENHALKPGPSKDAYVSMFAHSRNAMLLTAPDGRIFAANPAACELFGRTEEEICRNGRSGIVDAADPNLAAALAERVRSGHVLAEITHLRADGTRFPAEVLSDVFQDASGEARSVVLIRDTSERKASERLLSLVSFGLNRVREVALLVDKTARIVYVNDWACRALEYSRDELLSLSLLDIDLDFPMGRWSERWRELKEHKFQVLERQHRTKSGKVLDVEVSANYFEHEGSDYILGLVRDITQRKRLEAKARQLNTALHTLRRINEHLLVATDEQELYQFVCDSLAGVLDIVGAWIGKKMPDFTIRPIASAGTNKESLGAIDFRWDDSEAGHKPPGYVVRERVPVVIEDAAADTRFLPFTRFLHEQGLVSLAVVPVELDGEVYGVLAIWSKKRAAFDSETVGLLVEAAGDIAICVRSLQLSRKVAGTLKSLRATLTGTIEAIATLVEYRDPYTAGHERSVGKLAQAIGIEMELPERRVEGLRVIGYLHDIGKISIPAEILSKPSRLSEVEYALIKQHPQAGSRILEGMEFPWPVAQAVLQHHERLDGSGYPMGLKGDQIILEARILAVADTVEAMASHRPYRPALGVEAALLEIQKNRGQLYDPDVVDACVTLIRQKGYRLV